MGRGAAALSAWGVMFTLPALAQVDAAPSVPPASAVSEVQTASSTESEVVPSAALNSDTDSTAPSPYTAEEIRELEELATTVQMFEERAAEYREATRRLIEFKYQKKRSEIHELYENRILELEAEQRARRGDAIAKFERFLERYPADPSYSPDAMFRLSELYFERSYEDYFLAQRAFEDAFEKWEPNSDTPEPEEPAFHYEPTIAMMQRLIVDFPKYRLIDGAYYLLGYCLGEQGEEERAVDMFRELVARRPDSKFAPEVWTRIGEFYFDNAELERALRAYGQVLGEEDSPFYDKALYKLAWTHYRLADPERAPDEFTKAVDAFVALLDFNERTKEAGKERGADLRKESVQYIAISFADEAWGSTQKLLDYFDQREERSYVREVLAALGDVYFDQTRFTEAVQAYNLVQQRFPLDAEGPEVQQKIVTALERQRDFEGAAAARDLLTQKFEEGGSWHEANQDDADALAAAEELMEKSLYSAALFHHKQAQTYRSSDQIELATQAYGRAAKAYGKYLQRFPHDKQLYELKFYHADALYYSLQFLPAAEEYQWVRDSDADDRFLPDAALSTVLAYENAIKTAETRGELAPQTVLTSTQRPEGAPVEPQEIPMLRKQLIRASDIHGKFLPDSERNANLAYKAAETFYAFAYFEEARRRFQAILQRYPNHEVAQYAANLIIESHLVQQNFNEVEAFTRRMLAQIEPGAKLGFAGSLVKFKTGAMFKVAEDLDARGEHEQAAQLYLKMLEEHPSNEFADSALNNAAVAYEKVSRFESASRLYERLVTEHPKSPLADTALFRVGLNAERFFDFEKAIEMYLKLVNRYPKSERRADAIYNVALSLENTQNYERSAKQYLRYCQLFPKRDDAPVVCFRAGSVYEKMGDYRRVISTYTNFIKRYRSNAEHRDRIIEAYLKIAKANEKLKREREATKNYRKAIALFDQGADEKSGPYAAEAKFQLVERKFRKFQDMRIAGNSKQQKKMLPKKAKGLKEVEDAYKSVLKFKQIDWTLASLFRIGQLYQDMASKLVNAPCPPDVKRIARRAGFTVDEVCLEYRIALEEQSYGIEDKAVQAFETTIQKAREFQVVNTWTKQTLVELNRLRRSDWPLQKDAKTFVDAVTIAPPPLVGDNADADAAAVNADEGEAAPEARGASSATDSEPSPSEPVSQHHPTGDDAR